MVGTSNLGSWNHQDRLLNSRPSDVDSSDAKGSASVFPPWPLCTNGPWIHALRNGNGLTKQISGLPSGYVKIAIENGPFIVDFPIKHGDFP